MESDPSEVVSKSALPLIITISAGGAITKLENVHSIEDLVPPCLGYRQLFVVLPSQTLEFGPFGNWARPEAGEYPRQRPFWVSAEFAKHHEELKQQAITNEIEASVAVASCKLCQECQQKYASTSCKKEYRNGAYQSCYAVMTTALQRLTAANQSIQTAQTVPEQKEPHKSVSDFLHRIISVPPAIFLLDKRVVPFMRVCAQFPAAEVYNWQIQEGVLGKFASINGSMDGKKVLIHLDVEGSTSSFLTRQPSNSNALEVSCNLGHIKEVERVLFELYGPRITSQLDATSLVALLLSGEITPSTSDGSLTTLQNSLLALATKKTELMTLDLSELLALSGALSTASHVINSVCASKCTASISDGKSSVL